MGKINYIQAQRLGVLATEILGRTDTAYSLRRLRSGGEAPEKDLPVKLPKVKFYEPTDTGESPLAKMEKWVNVKCPKCDGKGRRETNTMPQWAGSSWYYLRYIDPKIKRR